MALVSPKTGSLPSSREGSQENRVFSIRIVSFDHYTAPPLPELDLGYSTFQGRTIEEVPVVRIFGSTTAGQKTCLHLHRIFPYFYVPYEDDLPQDVNEAFAYVRCLGLAIEQAMKMSSHAAGKKQHVHCCSLVRGRKYYGYHSNEQLFIKIVLYHPQDVSRLTALLTAGGIMNRKFQPHESHIPYLLQFLIDHNLSGMAHIHLAKVKLRHPVPDHSLDRAQLLEKLKESFRKPATQAGEEGPMDILVNQAPKSNVTNDAELPGGPSSSLSVGDESNVWLKTTVPVEWIWTASGDAAPSRHSTCELEGDALAEDILNKRDLLFVPLQTAGPDIRMVQSLVPIWEEELQRTGEEGAAGPLAQSSPGERMLPPISTHEQAMRDALSDIVCQFESRHAGAGNTQGATPLKSPQSAEVAVPSEVASGNMGELVQNQALEMEDKSHATLEQLGLGQKGREPHLTADQVSSVSPQRKLRDLRMAGSLLKCTQAANLQEVGGPQDEGRPPQDCRSGLAGSGEMYFPGQDHMEGLVNEEIVKEQFTQASEPQGTEREVLDLLCWMGGAQDEIDVEASKDGDEQGSQELEFSQMFRLSGVQAALTRALSAYEVASNTECQEILSCYGEGKEKLEAESSEEEARHGQGLTESSDEDNITSLIANQAGAEPWQKSRSLKSGGHMNNRNAAGSSQSGPTIPQIDGQYDEQNDFDTKGGPCCSGDRPVATETPMLTTDLDSMSPSHPQVVRPSSPHLEKGVKRKTSSMLQASKLPAVKAAKPQVSWCTLPVTGIESASAASGHKREEQLSTEKGLLRTPIAETGLTGETSKLKRERSSSLRDLMRRRRARKRKQWEAGHQNETGISVDTSEPKRAAGMEVSGKRDKKEQKLTGKWDMGLSDRGDNRDCGGGQEHENCGPVLGQEGACSLQEPTLETGNVHKLSLQNTSSLPEDQENLSSGCKSTVKGDNGIDPRHDELLIVGEQCSVANIVGFHNVENDELGTGGEDHENCRARQQCVSQELSPRRVCETPKQAVCYSNNPRGDISVMSKEPQTQCLRFGGAQHGSEHEVTTSTVVPNADSSSLQGLEMPFVKTETANPKTQLDRTGKEDLEACPGKLSLDLGLEVPAGHIPPAESHEQRDDEKDLAECILKQDCDSNSCWRKGDKMRDSTLVVYQENATETLYPLCYSRKPPSPAHCLDTFSNHGLNSEEHGTVFFGNVKDVSAQPAVMAGLVFHLRSKEGVHLPPFLFGSPGKVSRSEQASKKSEYVEKDLWGPQQGGDSRMGVPVHFENDGSIFYLLTPARSPPSCSVVLDWLQQKTSKGGDGPGKEDKQIFTMDPNTGKLVALEGDAQTQNTQTFTQGSLEDNEYYRPASPKYDEKHVLTVPFTSTDHDRADPSVYNKISVQRVGGKLPPDVSRETHNSGSNQVLVNAQDKVIGGGENQHAKKDQVSSKVLGGATDTTKDIARPTRQWRDVSQITAPAITAAQITPLSQSGFRDPASEGGGQQLTLASIEIYGQTRGDLRPDPRYDAIGCIVVVFQDDYQNREQTTFVLVQDETCWLQNKNLDGMTSCEVMYLPNEAALLSCLVQLVKLYDPDILIGWEIQRFSLGLLAERAANLGIGLLKQLSRTQRGKDADLNGQQDAQRNSDKSLFGGKQVETTGAIEPIIDDEWGRTHGSGIYVGGRIVLNLWRIMRGEVKLGIYSLEAVAEVVLRRRVPRIPWRTLTEWFSGGPGGGRFRCLEYFVDRARLNLQIMDQLDLVNRTAELARIFGIDFFSVFSRGSQYRVESMMLRLAHTQNFLMVSPSKQQVAAQPAMECLPLVMEPESRFYTSPVVVLDFQSLYPSIIIAYNLCFSTSLGKIVPQNPKQLGVTSMYVQPALLAELKDKLILTPNGVMFTPPEVCRGVLPRLLDEILSTRIMVKKAMKKLAPRERVRQRVLNARQFALKLIANVTYGYTAAGFSGRMPFAELADSIVQLGRITLERAINLVNKHPTWGARVVYGDTDSMFVLLEGRTREQAFKIGQEIASTVTAGSPPPIVLKMEKVYHPCVLLTKKRYVGYSYENMGQPKPIFDAKGIETVRRDSCAAVGKTMESCLRILFESKDLSKVKHYLRRQWGKIISGRISVRDFIFAKEVRLGTYSANASVLPPAAIVASKAMSVDPRAEPLYGERIPYVVIHGEPGARLVDMVVDPHTLLDNPLTLRLHDTYYITKQIIPALQRIFGLVGVELKVWYNEMPRVYQLASKKPHHPKGKSDLVKLQHRATHKATIDNYYLSRHCPVCGAFTRGSGAVCPTCSKDPMLVTVVMTGRTSQLERELKHLEAICRHCGGEDGRPEGKISCVSLDCPVFFERRKADKELHSAVATQQQACTSPHGLHELELF